MMTMAGGIYVAIRTVRIWLNKNERLCVGNRQNLTRTGNLPSRAYARSLSMYYPTIYGYHILGYMYFLPPYMAPTLTVYSLLCLCSCLLRGITHEFS